ncbi:hypothetical protein CJ204_08325 [Corynebacterium xerosis]|uniref:beta-fructofuranosidase n=1 Tax=Corynebacterium xerosis TaxID=1725 RepID=A0A2N6SXZ7_9CORY|nr:hypothetical protein [Corynebacterium xerosis]PMC61937.1 hypothetical protein CJ204_08325 [Corynebacterium xerosis]
MAGHRPAFHFTPERGRLNDPNGLIRLEGAGHDLWHVFYQLDPGFPAEPRRTGWGYATSEDLLTWRHRPQALFPDDVYDADGCFSGGAVAPQRPGDPVELFYTGNLPVPAEFAGHGSGSDPDAGRELLIDGPSPGGYMWECPNLLRMTDAATGAAADVLILSPQGIRAGASDALRNRYQCGCLVGHLELPDAPDAAATFHVTTPFTELYHGFEFFAPQVFTDAAAADAASPHRPVMLGWMGMPEEDDHPTITAEGWLHCLTFARRLSLYDGHLLQSPVLPLGDDLPIAGDGHVGDVFGVRLDGDGVVELRGVSLGSSTTGSTAADDGVALFSLRAFSADGVWTVRFT